MAKKITLKRAFDIGFSIFVLFFIFPFFLVLVLLVKFSSKGPVFYGSVRVGL
ncbi:MAG: sugar transferase, partial [Verrucomicrobia bacterium]|nr:sugar transferase [Verrucomicrobiota bacterium]